MAYTYLIGWPDIDRWYYGVRYASSATPDDLWVSYHTSSKSVQALRASHGEPPVVEIRRVFDDPVVAIEWERRVLNRMDVLNSDRWINNNVAGAIYIKKQTDEHIKKRTTNKKHHPRQREIALAALRKASESNTGKKQSVATQQKKRDTYMKNAVKNAASKGGAFRDYLIEGKIYRGLAQVMAEHNVTMTTVYNRIKNPKFAWAMYSG
jgi:hypothetical protein